MPYRQLPTTIIGRLNVLEKANEKVSSTAQENWAVSVETKNSLETLYTQFRNEYGGRQEEFARQAQASAAENNQENVLRQFVSHFIRVFNMAVERGKYMASDRLFYGLDVSQSELPGLSSEQELVTWAINLVTGEGKRMEQGGRDGVAPVPMSNPDITEVETELNSYIGLSNAQSAAKQAFDAENKDVLNMLPAIDSLIRDIYDEVEFYYRRQTASNKRKLAGEWGVVYVSRPGETPEEEAPEE